MKLCKTLISTVICVTLLLSLLPAVAFGARGTSVAYGVEGGNLYFDPHSGTVTACDAGVTVAEIPDEIQGVAVTTIGRDAFYTCNELTRVSMGQSVTRIEDFAFFTCAKLESVVIGSGVTDIGEYAFSGCSALKSLSLPYGLKSVGSFAFEDCMALTDITLPDSVSSVGCMAFTNTGYSREEGNWDGEVLYLDNHLLEAKTTLSGDYVVEDKTLTVAGYAFRGCKALTRVTIPSTLVSVYDFGFTGCSGLEELYYCGTEEMWKAVEIGASNEPLLNAKLRFCDESISMGHSLNLASDIAVSYMIPAVALEAYDSFYMECTLPRYEGNALVGKETLTLDGELRGAYWYFVLDGLVSIEMNNLVEARLFLCRDGVDYVSQKDIYSIATYAYNQLNGTTASEELKAVCANLLQYGAKAQLWKDYRTDALADGQMTEEHRSYLTAPEAVTFGHNKEILGDLAEPKVRFASMPLRLDSKIVLRYVVDLGNYEGALEDLNLRITYTGIDGSLQTCVLTDPQLYYAPYGYYAFDFDGLLGAELRTVMNVAVYEGDTRVSETLLYSADTYGNGKSGNILTLMQALFAYSDSARRYFEA